MEEGQQDRKRPASAWSNDDEGSKKRNCPLQDGVSMGSTGDIVSMNDSHCSVEELLSVPLDVILRQVPLSSSSSSSSSFTPRRKSLLTRAESHCLLRISQLATEIDILVNVASETLSRQRWCRSTGSAIVAATSEQQGLVLFRSVLTFLAIHGEGIAAQAMVGVQTELDRALYELGNCATSLRQYAEQNWTLSESLLDAFTLEIDRASLARPLTTTPVPATVPFSGQELAKEKRILGEIQDELGTRITRLIEMTHLNNELEGNSTDDAFDHATDETSNKFVSMKSLCYKLLHLDEDHHVDSHVENIRTSPKLVYADGHGDAVDGEGAMVNLTETGTQINKELSNEPMSALPATPEKVSRYRHRYSATPSVNGHTPDESQMTQGTAMKNDAAAALAVLASGNLDSSRIT